MDSVGQGGTGFDLRAWEAAIYRVCQPPTDWEDLSAWERDVLEEDVYIGGKAFSQAVSLDTARGCLRLLCRLWDNPGDRVDYGLPEAVLWRWLRRQVVGLVSEWTIDAHDTDGYSYDEPRKDAAVRLRNLLPAEPLSRAERERTYSDRLESIEIELCEATDLLAHLVVTTHAYFQPMSPWPALATLDGLVDQLVAARKPMPEAVLTPLTAPVSIGRQSRKVAGRKRVGPPPEEAYAACVALVNEYATLEGESPPSRREFADHLGIKLSTFDDRVVEFRDLGYVWPIVADDAA